MTSFVNSSQKSQNNIKKKNIQKKTEHKNQLEAKLFEMAKTIPKQTQKCMFCVFVVVQVQERGYGKRKYLSTYMKY